MSRRCSRCNVLHSNDSKYCEECYTELHEYQLRKQSGKCYYGSETFPPEQSPKHDDNKDLPFLMMKDFAFALNELARVTTYGANKYSPSGWLNVENAKERYSEAMMRHWFAHLRGEAVDEESGMPHLSHFTWNALAVLQLDMAEIIEAHEHQ